MQQRKPCECEIAKKEVKDALNKTDNKTPAPPVLQNNFLECFALKLKFHFYLSKKVFYLKNEVLLKNKLSLSSVKKR